MTSGKFFVGNRRPIIAAKDIIPFLGKASHWVEGRSAYEAASSWFDANDVPPAVRGVIETDAAFRGAILVEATFEKQTALDDFGRSSQTDVLARLQTPSGVAILGVEAKVDESFGPTVAEWSVGRSAGKERRLAGLVDRLGLEPNAVLTLRYQLLHRTAAALIESAQAGAQDAAMIVQSFSPDSVRAGFADFQAFAVELGTPVDKPGMLSKPIELGGVRLRLGWALDQIKSERLGR